MRVPTENAVAIGDIDERDADKWTTMGLLLIPYDGLLSVDLKAGETVVVSGATGDFGSAAVALAIGARHVVAPGRNQVVLGDLVRRFGARVTLAGMRRPTATRSRRPPKGRSTPRSTSRPLTSAPA